jgi:hypothetical protein
MISVLLSSKRLPYERALTTAKMPESVLHADGSLTICLPLPPREISPNARRGQSRFAALKKSRAVKKHRVLAKIVLGSALVKHGIERPAFTGYSMAFYFRTSAYRDDDNADGSCKAYRDGMATALGIDDRNLRKSALSTHAKDAKCPRVEITLHAATHAPGANEKPLK